MEKLFNIKSLKLTANKLVVKARQVLHIKHKTVKR